MVRKIAYRVIIFCLIGIICISAYNLITTYLKYQKARSEYNKISEIALVDTTQFTGEIDWDALHAINPDIVAWIYLKDSNINYPVVKGEDNEFYLHRTIRKEWDFAGTPFVDYRCENEFKDFNTLIYGHHMRDGSMFNNLSKYLREEDFYDTHKQFELITPEEKYHLIVDSGFYTKAKSYIYDCNIDNEDDEAINEFINKTTGSNQITHLDNVEVTPLDTTVTLSTCAYVYENARCVIIGKLNPWSDEEKEEAIKIQKKIDKINKKSKKNN